MKPSNIVLFENAVCGTSTLTVSTSTWGYGVVRASVQITVSSGSCVGTFRFQSSNDQAYGQGGRAVGNFAPTNWVTIGSSAQIAFSTTATATVQALIPTTETCYEHLRLVFADGSAGAAVGIFSARMTTFSL